MNHDPYAPFHPLAGGVTYTPFTIRSYSKTELALRYFPQAQPDSARHMLMRYIDACHGLPDRLGQLGYRKSQRMFTSGQVRAIVEALDEP